MRNNLNNSSKWRRKDWCLICWGTGGSKDNKCDSCCGTGTTPIPLCELGIDNLSRIDAVNKMLEELPDQNSRIRKICKRFLRQKNSWLKRG